MPDATFEGNRWDVQAAETLPWLVSFAEARKTVTYGDLSKLVGSVDPHTVLPRILGNIGHSLQKLSADIPPLQLLVVGHKTQMPGNAGLRGFLLHSDFDFLSPEEKRYRWKVAREKVFDWEWRSVLEKFELSPVSIGSIPIHEAEAEIAALCSHGSGEQEDHRRLKEYVANHPNVIGVKCSAPGVTEKILLSGDRLDILFDLPEQRVAVEIKGTQSPDIDVLRGMFQCVKYKAVLEAQRHYKKSGDKLPNIRVVLVLANGLPDEFVALKELLDVEVAANVKVPGSFSASVK